MITDILINTYTTGSQISPSIAALVDGGFVVSWQSYGRDHDNSASIYAQRYTANGDAQGDEFRVNTATAGDQMSPSITALADGGFVMAWMSDGQDGDGYGVYAQRYDSAGEAQGDEFRVNTTTANDQLNPSVAALANGGFVVSWNSYDQDGNSDVYAKRYDADGHAIEWIIPPEPPESLEPLEPPTPPILPIADRLYNWAESVYADLFPNHPDSQDILGYYARIYENGNALGERDDQIYFYDGNSIMLVGTVDDFLPDAITAGF